MENIVQRNKIMLVNNNIKIFDYRFLFQNNVLVYYLIVRM